MAAPFPQPLLGSLPQYPTVLETVTYQLNGLVVVFLALSMIWAAMEIVGVFFKRTAAKAERAAAATAAAAASVAASEAPAASAEQISILAAISAAVAVTLEGKPHRIRSIAPNATGDWAREGRRQIFASHVIR